MGGSFKLIEQEWKMISTHNTSSTNVQTGSIQRHYEQCNNLKYNKASIIHSLLITYRDIFTTPKSRLAWFPSFTLTCGRKQKIQKRKGLGVLTCEWYHVDVGEIRGRSRILKRGVPVCTWLLYLAKCNKTHKLCLLGGSGGLSSRWFQTFWDCFWCRLGMK